MNVRTRRRRALVCFAAALSLAGCGAHAHRDDADAGRGGVTSVSASTGTQPLPAGLLRGLRPIGRSERFHPRVLGSPTGGCAARPGADEAHLELFGANRVVLIAAGVGISRRPSGTCYGNVVTLTPTGVVHFRPGATLQDVFTAWGEPLRSHQMASFRGPVRYYVAGRRAGHVTVLHQHEQIVIEVGPYVPPHARFSFPTGL